MKAGLDIQDSTSERRYGHGYAKANGIPLHYAESGGGENFVILLHGFPEFWYSWHHQLTARGNRFTI